ncbi:hypothetical protein HK101_005659 [Irineochytrium annulatum]|nr:hypothetical protein HK101_005659 [Irineochytrium annulatum]
MDRSMYPTLANPKNQLGGASTVQSCKKAPLKLEISPTSFHVFGCESKLLANRWMKNSFPISPNPSFSTHWIATAPPDAAGDDTPRDSSIDWEHSTLTVLQRYVSAACNQCTRAYTGCTEPGYPTGRNVARTQPMTGLGTRDATPPPCRIPSRASQRDAIRPEVPGAS